MSLPIDSTDGVDARSESSGRGYVSYLLLLIFLVALLNVGDRTIVSVMVDDIKNDLKLDDRQMGLVLGFAFSFIHMVAGLPLAWLADRVSARKVLALSLFAWSAMTALVGAAQNFWQLIIVRMGVGIGEAGGSPASQALIARHVPQSARARAMAILTLGALAGLGLGATYGSWASAHVGWRLAFVGAGVPGVVLALILWLTVRDAPAVRVDAGGTRLVDVVRTLLMTPSYVWLTAAASVATMTTMGRVLWEPTLLRRVFAIDPAQLGGWFFLFGILPSAAGTFFSGILVDRLAQRDRRWYAWMPALASIAIVPVAGLFYLWPAGHTNFGLSTALLLSIPTALLSGVWGPATMALAQTIVPNGARAVGAATWTMIANFIGYGLGALFVGDLTIRLEPLFGADAIRYALLALVSFSIVTALLYLKTAAALRKDATH